MSNSDKDHAGVIFPPPLIYLGFLLSGIAVDYFSPVPVLPDPLQYWAGAGLIVLGLAISLPAFVQFNKSGTSVRPDRPTTAIIVSGSFRFTRNPLYLSLFLVYAGIAVAADSMWMLALLAPLILTIHFGVVLREERYLEGKFGEAYLQDKSTVRRWI